MAETHTVTLPGGLVAKLSFTEATDGDFRVPPVGADETALQAADAVRRTVVDLPWTWIRQVHGVEVLRVTRPGEHRGAEADAAFTTVTGCPVAVTTADCAPVVLICERGVAAVHAGWRGLVGDIVGRTAEQLVAVAGDPVAAYLGPCINPGAYRFTGDALEAAVARFGPSVQAETIEGEPALDIPAAVALACESVGFLPPPRPRCTSDSRWYSHRSRADNGRQTAVAWMADAGEA